MGRKTLQFMMQHKNGTIIIAAGSAIVGTSGLVYNKVKNHEPKVVTEFRTNLRIYINEIRKCDVGIDKINNLMNPLDILKADKNYPKISIPLTSEELEILVRRVYEYTLGQVLIVGIRSNIQRLHITGN